MLLPSFEFHQPVSIEEALVLKNTFGSKARLLAGGTDLLVHLKKKLIFTENLISLSQIKDLCEITPTGDTLFIGACTTMAQLSASPVIREKFCAIKSGCDNLGTHLIRNRATIGGNACNGSPAGDTLPALLVYDPVAVVHSQSG